MAGDTAEQSSNGGAQTETVEAASEEKASEAASGDLNGSGDSSEQSDAEEVTAEGKAALAAFPDRTA